MRVRYKARALHDLEAIHRYISQFDAVAAKTVIRRIGHSIDRLEILPMSGRASVKGTRLLVVPGLPYVVVHRIGESVVDIIAVLHTARRRRT